MFGLDTDLIQIYARNRFQDIRQTEKDYAYLAHTPGSYFYECTVTFNPRYWSLTASLNGVQSVVADLVKPLVRDLGEFQIKYSVEYHENNYPHVHFQIITSKEISPVIQHSIHQRFCRRYGRSDWWQTANEDKLHPVSGMLWSEYLLKDIQKNEQNGKQHYFSYYYFAYC